MLKSITKSQLYLLAVAAVVLTDGKFLKVKKWLMAYTYQAAVTPDQLKLVGTGNEVVSGTDSVKVQIIVLSDTKIKTFDYSLIVLRS
jgi:hypothetical protein